jgi:hypothetical protein
MRTLFFASILVPLLILIGCTPDSNPSTDDGTQPAISDESPAGDSAATGVKAREALAERLGVDANDIAVESIAAREWSDSCLGLGGPAESCLAAITPGFAMTLVHDGTTYLYRTDTSGESVRAE